MKTKLFVSLGILWIGITSALSQVVVYEMEFEREPRSINFTFFEGGFLVLDGLDGTGSFIFTFQGIENNEIRDLYVRAENTVEAFTAIKRNQRKIVVRATAQTQTSLSHYLAIGELDDTVSLQARGRRVSFEIAPSIRGNVLVSDDESDVEFPSEDKTIGFAGMATMRLSFDRTRTRESNEENLTVAQTVSALITELEEVGFVEDGSLESPDDTTSTDNSDSSTDTTDSTATTTITTGS